MIAIRRLCAYALDWVVLAIWGGLIFGITMLVRQGEVPNYFNLWQAQLMSLALMTVPFVFYFALFENSGLEATPGKRILGLQVRGLNGGRVSPAKALLRNVLKFVPWEFGHLVANYIAYTKGTFPMWLWIPFVIGVGGCLWWVMSLFATGDTPYNRWVGVEVVKKGEPEAAS